MIQRKPDHDPVPAHPKDKAPGKAVSPGDHGHDNDNGEDERESRAVAPAPAAGALISLQALQTALNAVDTGGVGGRSGLPMLQFKREGDGTWAYGQQRTLVENGSSWAINPLTFARGFICFSNDNKPSERLVPVSQPMPLVAELPDTGFEWTEEWAVNMKCLDGTDAGAEVVFKTTTVGGIAAVAGLIDAVRDRLNGGQHDSKIAPVVHLEKTSYQHGGGFGKIWTPLIVIDNWMSLDGPASPPPPPPPTATATEQPRRRRLGS